MSREVVVRGMILYILVAVLLLGPALASAAQFPVGPGKAFTRIEPALAAAHPGDTILVYPQQGNQPYERVALFITTPRLTLKAVTNAGQYIPLNGSGFDYSGVGCVPRAIVQFSPGADGCALEGFELSEAHNDSHNGAGVRINQANDITIRRCLIHRNDMGIMSNGNGTPATAARQLIESCLIHSNGNLQEPGQNHNLYLGGTSVKLVACEIHSSLTGHNLKSRAHQTVLINCYIHDSANRELDLVDAKGDTTAPGSDAVLFGNIIVKAPHCPGNRAVIHFGQDRGDEHDGTIWLVNNTIVTPFIAPVLNLSASKAKAQILNNIVWDGGARQNGQTLVEASRAAGVAGEVQGHCNWLAHGFGGAALEKLGLEKTFLARDGQALPFVDAARGDFHLSQPESSVVDHGEAPPAPLKAILGPPLHQYRHPMGQEDRPEDGKPDLGAYEYAPVPR